MGKKKAVHIPALEYKAPKMTHATGNKLREQPGGGNCKGSADRDGMNNWAGKEIAVRIRGISPSGKP